MTDYKNNPKIKLGKKNLLGPEYDECLKKIEKDLYTHNELAKSQNEWLISRVKALTKACEAKSRK